MKKAFILLFLIGFLLYLPSLSGPFLWDDEDFVYANKYVENFRIDKFFTDSQTAGRGKLSNYYRPVPQIVHAATHAFFGFNPFWYHLVNVLAHISAAGAIFYFFHLLISKGWQRVGSLKVLGKSDRTQFSARNSDQASLRWRADRTLPFLIATFFLIHPVQTEAVSYISGLSDPLFVLFGFLSLIFFLTNRLLPAVICFALSLLSKETGIVFLPLLFLASITKGLTLKRSDLLKISSFLLTALLYLWFHLSFINQLDIKSAWGNSLYANSITVRLLTFVQNLYTYFGLLLFPKDLFMERDYSVFIQTNLFNPYLLGFIILVVLIIFILCHLPGNRFPLSTLWFCFLGFFIASLPYSGIVLINGIFYEHFLYLPLVFFFAFIFTIGKFARPPLAKGVITIWLLLLVTRNISRQLDWTDSIRFYSQTLAHAPQSIRIRNGLAMAYAERGNLNNAISQYQQAIRLNPTVPNLYHNLANAYAAQGNIKSAEENYLKAIAVDPNFLFSYQSLANLYQQTAQTEKLQKLISQFKARQQP